MTELAYMVRSDWAQHGTAMERSSAEIRAWLGDAPRVFAVLDASKYTGDRTADLEAATFITPRRADQTVVSFGALD